MATASKTWTWDSTLESYVATADGDGNAQRDASNGSPNAGSLQMYLTPGRTQSGNGYFDLTTGTWASLFGISSSATVTDVQVLAGTRSYCGLTHWLAGQNFNSAAAYVQIYDTSADWTIWSRGFSGQDSGWNTGSAGDKRTLTTPQAASSTVDFRVLMQASTGNTANSTVSVHLDYLTIEVTYTIIKNGTAPAVAAVAATATGTKTTTKNGTASATAVASTFIQTTLPLTVWSSTADGYIWGQSTTYATARSTATTANSSATTMSIGQAKDATIYYCQECFLDFNTSTIGAGETVSLATLSLYGSSDSSDTDFTIQARIFDWSSGGLTTADWRSGNPSDANSLDEYTLVATYATSGGWPTNAYSAFTSETAFPSNVSKTGTTYVLGHSYRQLNGDTPTGWETVYAYSADDATGGGTDRDPKLYVEHTGMGGGPTGTKTTVRNGTSQRINFCGGPSFELDVEGSPDGIDDSWALYGSKQGTPTTTLTTGTVVSGTYAQRVQYTGVPADTGAGSLYLQDYVSITPAVAGDVFTASASFWGTSSGVNFYGIAVMFADSGWGYVDATYETGTPALTGSPVRHSVTVTCPANTAYVLARPWTFDGISDSDTIDCYADAVLLERGSTLGTYFDGTTSGARWYGTAHKSASVMGGSVAVAHATATGSKTGGTTYQGTANVACCASTGGVTADSLTVWSSTADGYLEYESNVWANVYSASYTWVPTTSGNLLMGEDYSDPAYTAYNSFVSFDTSSVGSGSTVTTATLSLYGQFDYSQTDFTLQARIRDWGESLTTDDKVGGATLSGCTLVASHPTASGWPTNAYTSLTSESAFLTNIAKTGTTYLCLHNKNFADNVPPTQGERVNAYSANDNTGGGGTDRDPKLYVEWTTAGGGAQGSRIRQRTADVVVAVEATATGSKTGGTTYQGTANVFPTTVATASGSRIRGRTANVFACAVSASAGGGIRKRTATPVVVAVSASSGSKIGRRTGDVFAVTVATATGTRVRKRTADAVVTAVATASGAKFSTKLGTANVFACAVTANTPKRIRSRTANVFSVLVATAGSVKPARSSPVVAVAIAANGARVRRATANVFAAVVAAAGSIKPARTAAVVTAVATAAGVKVRRGTADVFATAVSAVNGSKIGRRTADVFAVAVSASTGKRLRSRTSDVAVTAVSASSGSKIARRTSEAIVVVVASATGTKLGTGNGTSNIFATAVASANAVRVRSRTSEPVVVAEATATGARVSRRTASTVAVASATAQGRNICAVSFTEPHDNDRYERTVGGTVAWTCTPVSGVTFHLYAVARTTAVEYYLKDVAADGSGSYSTSSGFEIPPGQFRMKAVVD